MKSFLKTIFYSAFQHQAFSIMIFIIPAIMIIMIIKTLLYLQSLYKRLRCKLTKTLGRNGFFKDAEERFHNHINVSKFNIVGWVVQRRRGSTIRLGNKAKRRGFSLGSRPVVQWGVMVGPLRMLKKIIMEITPKGKLIEAYYMYLPFLRPQLFPFC